MYSNTFFSVESRLRNVLRTHKRYFPAPAASGYPQTTSSACWFQLRRKIFVTRGDVWILIPVCFWWSRLLCEICDEANDVFQRWNEQPSDFGRWMILLLQSAAVQTENCCRTRTTRCLLGLFSFFFSFQGSRCSCLPLSPRAPPHPPHPRLTPRPVRGFTRWHCWQQAAAEPSRGAKRNVSQIPHLQPFR